MAQPGAQQAAQDGGSGASAYVSPYQPLAAENPDFYGWLAIEGTAIDYPVMHTPDDPRLLPAPQLHGRALLQRRAVPRRGLHAAGAGTR